MKIIIFIILIFFISINISLAKDYIYILNSKESNEIYNNAINHFKTSQISVFKDIRGVVISFYIEDLEQDYTNFSKKTIQNLEKIEYFLAKNKNPVIIEVHTTEIPLENSKNLKNWEISTIIANKIEVFLRKRVHFSNLEIKSVGYGEFMPSKNTPNNGVKNKGRVDIIILCSINGE